MHEAFSEFDLSSSLTQHWNARCSISHTDWPILFFSRTGKTGTHVKRLNEHLTRLRASREVKRQRTSWTKNPNEILMIINMFKWNTYSRRSALLHHQCNYSHRNMRQINELWQHVLQLLQLAFSKYSPVQQPILLRYSQATSSCL